MHGSYFGVCSRGGVPCTRRDIDLPLLPGGGNDYAATLTLSKGSASKQSPPAVPPATPGGAQLTLVGVTRAVQGVRGTLICRFHPGFPGRTSVVPSSTHSLLHSFRPVCDRPRAATISSAGRSSWAGAGDAGDTQTWLSVGSVGLWASGRLGPAWAWSLCVSVF